MIIDPEFEYPPGIQDLDGYDAQTYLEGGTKEALAAAERLDRRSVTQGQMPLRDYVQAWGLWPEERQEERKQGNRDT